MHCLNFYITQHLLKKVTTTTLYKNIIQCYNFKKEGNLEFVVLN